MDRSYRSPSFMTQESSSVPHAADANSLVAPNVNQDLETLDDTCPQSVMVLPDALILETLRNVDEEYWNEIKSECAIGIAADTRGSIYRLPVELIHQVYYQLSAPDFDAARQVCHFWRLAALDRLLLITMFQRAGWWRSMQRDLRNLRILSQESNISLDESLYLSQRLSRECSLLPPSISSVHTTSKSNTYSSHVSLSLSGVTDMSELVSRPTDSDPTVGCHLQFTASVCGQYVLVVDRFTIYVYRLSAHVLEPTTSIVCPKRVLAASMDTSSGRYAVAALLEGRMGLVCDIELDLMSDTRKDYDICKREERVTKPTSSFHAPEENLYSSHIPAGENGLIESVDIRYNHEGMSLANMTSESQDSGIEPARYGSISPLHRRQHGSSPSHRQSQRSASTSPSPSPTNRSSDFDDRSPRTWRSSESTAVPSSPDAQAYQPLPTHEMGSLSPVPSSFKQGSQPDRCVPASPALLAIYHNICTPDDPPRSVAICPSRKCVAYGCHAGIELHWVDARGGRNLMKWFPLTAPSDFLYFLPRREGYDSPNKLRLVSSKAGSGQRGGTARFASKARSSARRAWSWRVISGSVTGFESMNEPRAATDYDHFAAVPTSDGSHLLFTDPSSGALHLGSDAPVGGPTKLIRKVRFVPPEGIVDPAAFPSDATPRLYAAAADTSWGARVVAVHEDTVVFYTVPEDMLEDVRHVNGSSLLDVGRRDLFGEWSKWHYDTMTCPPLPRWPVPIRGAWVADVPGIVDVAVQGSPHLTIWTFSRDGMIRTFQIGPHERVARRYVDANGNVNLEAEEWGVDGEACCTADVDEDGDVRMQEPESEDDVSILSASVDGDWSMSGCRDAQENGQFDGVCEDVDVKVFGEPGWDVEVRC
ncbi:MAG: hypothetical protein M1828_000041 [Chrysothrix sp. TS-e1954]|nr:MAG: hypothetical protein M1828_000041 [Chrysothrix sp. TS-e1954]